MNSFRPTITHLILMLVPTLSLAASEPPNDRPIGEEEYRVTGQLPKSTVLPKDENRTREAMFSAWDNNVASFQAITNKKTGKVKLSVALRKGAALDSSRYRRHLLYSYEVNSGEIVPLFNQLYLVQVQAKQVVLKRVTEHVPEELRPVSDKSYTLSVNELQPILFEEILGDPLARQSESDHAKLTVKETLATIILEPEVVGSPVPTSSRRPLTIEVKKGDVLSARGKSYRVLNVVPETAISGGTVTAYVELSDLPVKME